MTQHERSTVVGVFDDSSQARDAIQALKDAGFAAQDIGILMRDRGEAKDMAEETGSHAGEGAGTGLIAGGILGGLAGWLVGIGALAIPGVGPIIAAGAFGTALAGAGIGAGVGAIAGALVGMGIPKEEAEFYEGEVKSGRTLVTVSAPTRYDEARDILRQHGAYDVHDRTAADTGRMATSGTTSASYGGTTTEGDRDYDETGARDTDSETMRLREERLRAEKETRPVGEVGAHKEVVSEEQSMEVPVTHEEVYVERHPVDRPADRPIGEDEDQDIRMKVHEERAVPEKETFVREEVEMGKRPVEDTQRVGDTVRREELKVEKEGDFEITGGEGYGPHEHKWVNDRCEICGATRRYRRAA